ncbi:MAG: DUF4194 domain-containing protein [Bacilli bacterium]|nr:DUF4194 domain-containing protein [Bacilli bacterium]
MANITKTAACERFSAIYMTLNETKKNIFARLISKLLTENFIYGQIADDRNDYYAILENKEAIQDFLLMAGFELMHKDTQKIFYLYSETERNRVKLKKLETVLLLILRLEYYKKSKAIDANTNISVDSYDVISELQNTGIMKDKLVKTELIDALKTLKRNKLINFDVTQGEISNIIEIYPTVALIVTTDDITALNARIESYTLKENDDETDED